MSKKNKSKKSSLRARVAGTFPEYVNAKRQGAAPSPQRYQDAPRKLIVAARDATRVTAANDVLYNGKLWYKGLLFGQKDLQAFKRTKRSSHQIREIVKGLIQLHPNLQTAAREQLGMEVIFQLLQASGRIPKVPKSWDDVLKVLLNYMPLGAMTHAMSLMRRHDRDIEEMLNVPFWAKHMPGRPAPATTADRQSLVHDFVRRRWQAGARSARTQVTTCNDLKQRFGGALRKASKLTVTKRRAPPLTDNDILGI